MRADDKESPLFNGSASCDSTALMSEELPQHVPMITLEDSSNATQPHTYNMTLSSASARSMASPDDAVCTRIENICKRDFRNEGWYVDHLLFIMALAAAVASVILPMAKRPKSQAVFMLGILTVVLPASVICLVTTPLCGVIGSLQRRGISQRHPLSVIRLATDSGKTYRIQRRIYFLLCPIVTTLFSGLYFASTNVRAHIIAPALWYMVCFLVFFCGLLMGLSTICYQIFT